MVTVRTARSDDGPRIQNVHVTSIRELGTSHYTPEQVDAWADADRSDYPIEESDQHVVVAEDGDTLVGFGGLDLDGAKVWAVYVHPQYARRGVGSRLLERLESTAEQQFDELSLWASMNAVPFYRARGYDPLEQVTHQAGDQTLDCVEMRKQIRDDQ